MGILDLLFGKPKRRRKAHRSPSRAQLDRQASAWLAADNRRRRTAESQRKRQALREAEMAAREDKRYRRTRAKLEKDGWLGHEIDELLHGVGYNPSRRAARMQAACGGLCISNPSPEEWSSLFHGTPTKTRDGTVVVGSLESLTYRAPAGSSRAGAHWVHESGDRGALRSRNRGRGRVLADPKTGHVEVDLKGSGMRFDPSRGLVG